VSQEVRREILQGQLISCRFKKGARVSSRSYAEEATCVRKGQRRPDEETHPPKSSRNCIRLIPDSSSVFFSKVSRGGGKGNLVSIWKLVGLLKPGGNGKISSRIFEI